jgi:glycosyltransferase involved in cell wall biosynthesis
MAAGKPVVAFDIDHLNELVRPPWGVLVPPLDADRLGRAVADLWESPRACREAGEAARREAERYRWDRLAWEQEQFYTEIVEGRSP